VTCDTADDDYMQWQWYADAARTIEAQQYVEAAQAEHKALAAMYAEFVEEDRQLVQIGQERYAHVLAQEEAQA
jgi:hypothetical protein